MGVALQGLQAGLFNQSSAQVIDGSLKFNSGSSNYLNRTHVAGNRKTFTFSKWVKRNNVSTRTALFGVGTAQNDSGYFAIEIESAGDLRVSGWNTLYAKTNAVLRDSSAWYHFVIAVDTTQAAAADQVKIYQNGSLLTKASSSTITQNADLPINSASLHNIGYLPQANQYGDKMFAQVNFIDGQALDASYFGFTDPLTNTWRPKKYTGSFDVTSSTSEGQSTSLSQTGWAVTTPTPQTNIWDGNTSTTSNGHNGGTIGTVTFTPALTGVTKVELYTQNYVHYLNGSSISTPESTNGGWHTYHDGSAITLNSVGNAYSNNTQTVDLMAIRINGHIIDSQTWTLPGETTTTNTNSFYLPMDGNSPIGEDKSGRGNNWTPQNFGGSVTLDNPIASGARPILNTDGGGNVARPGVFGSEVGAYYAVTVASVGGGNRYHFDGVDRPNPTLIRGATYTFDQSDASNGTGGTHPLRFATAADAAGSTQYTDGVVTNGTPGQAGAYTKITVPHNAPATLYYYCTNHGNMGSSTSQITDETKADPYAWKNVLALPLNGSEGGTTINDVHNLIKGSGSAKAISIYTGSTSGGAVTSDDQSQYYGSSFYVVRGPTNNYTASDYIYRTGDTDLAFGTGDFTVEFWYYPTGLVSNSCHFDNRHQSTNWPNSTNGFQFNSNSSGNLMLRTGSGNIITVSSAIVTDKWHHLAITRSSSTIKLFVNGIERGSASNSNDFNEGRFHLGSGADNGEGSNGYYADLRIYKGVAKYTSDFVVASTSPDILPDTPSGVSGSSKLTKVPDSDTEGAVSFGSKGTDYMKVAETADFGFGTGDWTIEGYFYISISGSNRVLWDLRNSSGNYYFLRLNGTATYRFQYGSSTVDFDAADNRWNHIAISRSSNTTKIFVNGTQTNSFSDSTDSGTGTLHLSTFRDTTGSSSDYGFGGFLSNFRVIKGTAVYTSNFTPSTAPLTNVTNTKLLCCQSNTSVTAAAVTPGTITTGGEVAVSNFGLFNTDINTVRGQETGYCTMNPLDTHSGVSLSNGNLQLDRASNSWDGSRGTIGMTSGKWYFEHRINTGLYTHIGIQKGGDDLSSYVGDPATGWSYSYEGKVYNNQVDTPYGNSYTTGDLVACAFDADAGKLYFYKNGVIQNTGTPAFTGLTDGPYYPALSLYGTISVEVNFGQKPFKFPPPAGFQPLNAANVKPETVITRPDQFVGTTLYTGNGGTKSVNVGLKPDLVWLKARTEADWHLLMDTVRGNTSALFSNSTQAQETLNGTTQLITSFNRDGFTVVQDNTSFPGTSHNQNSQSLVAWTWRAGGNKNTFNVDDVGYASAADVNMSVDSLNSVAYDKSVTWSSTSGMSTPANAFDGSFSTGATVSSSGSPITVTTGSFTASSISFYKNGNNDANLATVTINNTIVRSFPLQSTATGWVTVDLGSEVTVTSLKTTWYGAYTLYAVKYDTKLLVDNGTTTQNVPSIANTGASVGTKQGFSITTFTTPGSGTFTYSHGLSQPPNFIITKATNQSYTWTTYHVSAGATKYLVLNTQGAAEPGTMWNNTTPSSLVVYGNSSNFGTSTNYVTYQWHDVPGLQKFGSFEANQNADGPFIELGFRPAIVWIKNIDNYDPPYDWVIYDNARSTINPNDKFLSANLSNQENSGSGGTDNSRYVDFLSNGFKVRTASTAINLNAHTQIYCAWAEAPTVNLYGGQSNAR